ncbi:uncharacterized protein MELLADRAFT_108924 [Melampsora larici-populina 98AG31]|uniref:Uncharacterized protein n=1 Tax=Melampsora larici-populina (strain 98AG31 / pathotype 3-4-7) TaxID=747676 RepID=F4RUR7_MELLP|nr:uncharacterized protein MELLADRAFT_108924 [Melampsora larici-populina 98AG31]EGG03876.1 hypothetical protein MELLADRAFT_108924 [Melampsora larici-populina 98AG31]
MFAKPSSVRKCLPESRWGHHELLQTKAIHLIKLDLTRTHLMEEISVINDDSQATQDMPPASQGDWLEKMFEVTSEKQSENILPNPTHSQMLVLPRINPDSRLVMSAEEDEDSAVEYYFKRLESHHQNLGVPKISMGSIKGSYPRRPMVIAPIVKAPPILPTEESKENTTNIETHIEMPIEDTKPLRLPSRQRVRDSIYKAFVRSRPAKRHELQAPMKEESNICRELTNFERELDLLMYSLVETPSPNRQTALHPFSRPRRYIGPKPAPRSPIKIYPLTELNDVKRASAEPSRKDKCIDPKLQHTKPKSNFNASLCQLPSIPEAGLTEPRRSCSGVIRSERRTSQSPLMIFKTRPRNRQVLESQLRIAEQEKNRISLNRMRKSIASLPKRISDSMMINRSSTNRDWFLFNDEEEGVLTVTPHPQRREWLVGFMKMMLILGLLIPIIVLVIVFHKRDNIVLGINSS